MKDYKFHEVAGLFPLIEGKKFDELVEDIKQNLEVFGNEIN